jgi:hypothetical protein
MWASEARAPFPPVQHVGCPFRHPKRALGLRLLKSVALAPLSVPQQSSRLPPAQPHAVCPAHKSACHKRAHRQAGNADSTATWCVAGLAAGTRQAGGHGNPTRRGVRPGSYEPAGTGWHSAAWPRGLTRPDAHGAQYIPSGARAVPAPQGTQRRKRGIANALFIASPLVTRRDQKLAAQSPAPAHRLP